ncbi:MAG: hypothetical protein IPK17_37340 [Chloroflexi bacterium]|uniref:hypothetical protein n=1 Tax=Candidatus Flexifilum breve TaxID=3140694 RepID=UPI003136EAAC|nr:hypothetical protein [Chloroflexota bacterium]
MDNGVSARDNARDAVLSSRRLIHSLKARADERRTTPEKIADALTSRFGSMGFLIFNVVWFTIWLAWNNGQIPAYNRLTRFRFNC